MMFYTLAQSGDTAASEARRRYYDAPDGEQHEARARIEICERRVVTW